MNNRCTHRQYYAQFVTEEMKSRLVQYIGLDRLLESKDEHLNDISLRTWDLFIAGPLAISLRSVGDYPTIAGNVCIAKEAARQIIEEHQIKDTATGEQHTRNMLTAERKFSNK
jgi:hypothetical protein